MKTYLGSLLTISIMSFLLLVSCDSKKSPSATDNGANTEEVAVEGEWCAEHGVPESICTRCHPNLIAEFKQKSDWCKEHNLPESQCTICDPTLTAKFEAMKPKA